MAPAYLQEPVRPRGRSPSPSLSPTPAMGAYPRLSRCVSMASTASSFSGRSSSMSRASLGSTASSRQSSASYTSRLSMGGSERSRRRGYVRPQGTEFATSAQSRDSVMSLGSIAHLQYYFARTGLLDGKGGRAAKKKGALGETQLSTLNTNLLCPTVSGRDSSYSSPRNSTELNVSAEGLIVGSPVAEEDFEEYYSSDDEPLDMLPPTVSTYKERQKYIPPPPTLLELKSELESALTEASKILVEAKAAQALRPSTPRRRSETDSKPEGPLTPQPSHIQGWHEIQGVQILDVLTLAIRAARRYYTAHDQPSRLAAIKSERMIRAELLSVLDVLKRMATRNFAQGMKADEGETMENWIENVWNMLRQEEAMERLERNRRLEWPWLDDAAWPSSSLSTAREEAFLQSMNPDATPLPPYTPSDLTTDPPTISPFLQSLSSGLRLVQLHNAIVKLSQRHFGAISAFHTDTRKPYRSAENLRFWIKAAELRWDVHLDVDVMAVVNGDDAAAWSGFEEAIWKWSAAVRSEISAELKA